MAVVPYVAAPLDVARGFWPADEARAAWERVRAAGRLFAGPDGAGRLIYAWEREDAPDLWDEATSRLLGMVPTSAHATSRAGEPHACYAIRYPQGAELRQHTDNGNARMILVARAPAAGGALLVDGREVRLDVGDAVFFVDSRRHGVARVVGGERWALTMGRLR